MGKRHEEAAKEPVAPFNSPFARLAGQRDSLPQASALPDTKVKAPAATKRPSKSVVVRYERKGHGGKEMTRLERLELSGTELNKWLKEAKQALGCGGVVDGDDILLQGDQRERAAAWLAKRNIRTTIS
ncbi:MAG: translation initiation factor [Myxococcota bacterium]|nr:translation initiation factor [Myxococcota bacterium]